MEEIRRCRLYGIETGFQEWIHFDFSATHQLTNVKRISSKYVAIFSIKFAQNFKLALKKVDNVTYLNRNYEKLLTLTTFCPLIVFTVIQI
jgi:hypothetical protein